MRRLQLAGHGASPAIGSADWQGDRERTAGPGAGRHRHAAAMCGNDLSDEREPESVAVDLTRDRVGAAIERIEDVREFRCRNAAAVIADGDAHLGTASLPPACSTRMPTQRSLPPYFTALAIRFWMADRSAAASPNNRRQIGNEFALDRDAVPIRAAAMNSRSRLR